MHNRDTGNDNIPNGSADRTGSDRNFSSSNSLDAKLPFDREAVRGKLGISPREMDVLSGIYLSMPYHQIAEHLGLSRHTVVEHWRSIEIKLSIKGHRRAVQTVDRVAADLRIAQAVETAVADAIAKCKAEHEPPPTPAPPAPPPPAPPTFAGPPLLPPAVS